MGHSAFVKMSATMTTKATELKSTCSASTRSRATPLQLQVPQQLAHPQRHAHHHPCGLVLGLARGHCDRALQCGHQPRRHAAPLTPVVLLRVVSNAVHPQLHCAAIRAALCCAVLRRCLSSRSTASQCCCRGCLLYLPSTLTARHKPSQCCCRGCLVYLASTLTARHTPRHTHTQTRAAGACCMDPTSDRYCSLCSEPGPCCAAPRTPAA